MIIKVNPSRMETDAMDRGDYVLAMIYKCHICHRSCSYRGMPLGHGQVYKGAYADTRGKEFKAYLCPECASALLKGEAS